MQAHHQPSPSKASYRSTTPPLDSSSEDLDICVDYDLDDLEDLEKIDEEAPRKPHFLDYDYVPPPGYEETVDGIHKMSMTNSSCSAAAVATSLEHKIDKKYERDGEISDSALKGDNPKRERIGKSFSTNTERATTINVIEYVQRNAGAAESAAANTGAKKKKHFLDEAVPPPSFTREREREHRSLDRNFERYGENSGWREHERKLSLDRDGPPVFASPKFLDRDVSPVYNRGTWPTDKPNDIQSIYSSLPPGDFLKLGPKVECVYSLLSMLGSNDSNETSTKFLELSKSPETCIALRRSGCIPLLVQMIHSDTDESARKRAGLALHNVVHCHPDDKVGRREAKVLRLIEQIMEYTDFLKNSVKDGSSTSDELERRLQQAIYSLMKISFDEENRYAMCQLGALPAIANLVYYDHAAHGAKSSEERCMTLRRYSGMALTNLTFGDGNNKALLCSNKNFMKALVNQLDTSPEELIQVTACVLRNLSWRADSNMKLILTEIGAVTALGKAAMKNRNENTLKSILSALWNLTAHCSMNKAELCNVDGALAFLADMLVYVSGKNLMIVENAGGILRNLSSHIAVREDYRKILRQRNCLGILLQQLKSESLTVVSNACGTLWNLSARCPEDQKFLCDNGAVPMLKSLIHSKHNMIAAGSNSALKNLLNFKPTGLHTNSLDPIAKSMNLKELPTLNVRKQKALEADLDRNLSETCENIDVVTPPKEENNVQDFCNLDQRSFMSIPTTKIETEPSVSTTVVASSPTPPPLEQTRQQSSNDDDNFLKYSDEGEDFDQLTDFSKRYNRESDQKVVEVVNSGVYQETDLDQITDYSLLYSEHHERGEKVSDDQPAETYSSEILLTLEDTVKCYETEGTPYTISNATSMSDLRNVEKMAKIKVIESCGIETPEKPTNYCEEGTPGYFSRRDSISSVDFEATGTTRTEKTKIIHKTEIPGDIPEGTEEEIATVADVSATSITTPSGSSVPKNVTFGESNFALETPLMFSRHSSLGSIESVEEQNFPDDRSSVVSDFSRLASGIISPSELPDSPSQSMPQTPRTASHSHSTNPVRLSSGGTQPQPPLRSVFEDDVNTFGVEHTPAQFSCATSLSNLSLDDEPKIKKDVSKPTTVAVDLSVAEEKTVSPVVESTKENSNEIATITVEPNDDLKVEDLECKDGDSDGDESANDEFLLATCINIGMNRGIPAAPQNTFYPKDESIKYCTEDTPAILSKQGSNTNLSMLSVSTGNKKDESSDSSSSDIDAGHDQLLEECIRDGMKKSQSRDEFNDKMCKENPIAMMRGGSSLLPPYLPPSDETNKFTVEDSPCNFSTMSALSNLTIDSENRAALAQKQRPQQSQPNVRLGENAQQSNPVADDSLSSLSMDSEDDNNLLNQAIAAGLASKPKNNPTSRLPTFQSQSTLPQLSNQASTSSRPLTEVRRIRRPPEYGASANVALHDANDSISSIDSSDSNDPQQNSLLEQCIRSGMYKDSNRTKLSSVSSSTPKKYSSSHKSVERSKDRQKSRDEQLLLECINTGISKTTRTISTNQITIKKDRQSHHGQQLQHVNDVQNSKNGRATSVAVSDMKSAHNTATGVGKESIDGTNESNDDRFQLIVTSTTQNGCSVALPLDTSTSSINLFLNNSDHCLDRSNEYPALRTFEDSMNDSSSINGSGDVMNVSNEFLMDDIDSVTSATTQSNNHSKIDKHKDPDLMLKSVERLTHELVSTAEYLRTTTSLQTEEKKSSSNNTWNEDTCPNDVSFPSLSMTAPMIGSMNEDDATFSDINPPKSWLIDEATPTNEVRNFPQPNGIVRDNDIDNMTANEILRETSIDQTTITCDLSLRQNNDYESLEPESKTMTTQICGYRPMMTTSTNGINFEVGGEVKQGVFTTSAISKNLMTNSIIAMEAHKIVNELRNFPLMTESTTSLDLDNIRPPSMMENLSVSGYFEVPHSPQLSRSRKKSLPAGLLARRAIGQTQPPPSGSLESINSSYNLDNVKPPSLMDELLDSMISVASITSEVADNTTFDATSNYETALSDIDDTMTLQSCLDFSPIPSDFSSAESTPKKSSYKSGGGNSSRRNLTPKQKRQLVKERYRTYTIAADMVLKERAEELKNEQQADEIEDDDGEEIIQIVIDESQHRITPRQRRLENRERFQTQVLDSSGLGSSSSIEGQRQRNPSSTIDDEDDASLRELTARFKHISTVIVPLPTANVHLENDGTSIEYEQNSGTESCEQNESPDRSGDFKTFTRPTARISKGEKVETVVPSSPEPVKVIRGGKKAAYVSPYRRSAQSSSPKQHLSPTPNGRANLANKTCIADAKKNLKAPTAGNLIPRNQTIVSKTHVFMNKTNMTNKINGVKSKKPVVGVPKKGNISSASPPQLPDRQGTFVKDEPTNDEVPVVSSLPASPSKIPKAPMSKLSQKVTTPKSPAKTMMSKLKIPIHKSVSMDADKLSAAQRKPPIGSNKLKSPSSTSSLSSNEMIGGAGPKRRSFGVFKSPSVPSVSQRSNSNIAMKNANNNNNAGRKSVTNGPQSNPPSRSNSNVTKSNITSKIAGLWKKSESSAPKTTAKMTTAEVPEDKKLIRSSTFDAGPPQPQPDEKESNNNRSSTTMTSRFSLIASKYRSEPSTSAGKTIKSTTMTNGDGSTPPKSRISRIGTFVSRGSVDGTHQ